MMESSNINVRNADSGSMHKFPWKWNLSDLDKVKKNGLKVFSCFSCGGGSSMGYKLAGYTVIGNCEIDPRVAAVYKVNNHPKHSFLMDIREFNKLEELPEDLNNLDVLDGSPPCSVFSLAGRREEGWNKEKVFREGQAKQRLDDLFFHFIDTAKKLNPKVVVAENVEGLLVKNARGYVNEIVKAFDEAGYVIQIFLLDARFMGVPQKRRRVFFVGHRKDLDFPKLDMTFNEKPILFREIRSADGIDLKEGKTKELLSRRKRGDTDLSDIYMRECGKKSGFTQPINADDDVAFTITSGGTHIRFCDGKRMTNEDIINCQTFPQDYDFLNQKPQYICGMSVPPVMMAQVSSRIYEQWFYKANK